MGFTLELPKEEEIEKVVKEELQVPQEEKEAIDNTAINKAKDVMDADIDSFETRKEITDVINNFGTETLTKNRNRNELLEKRLMSYNRVGGQGSEVAKGLEDLTIQMKDLDPSGIDFAKSGKIGKLFNPVRRYFEKYNTADHEISTIIDSLDKGKKMLEDDNTTLEIEEASMREITKEMQKNMELGMQLDTYLTDAIDQAKRDGEDENKIKFVEDEVLFPLRQRVEDFQQILVVNQQGIIASEIIRKNNRELIRSVDRAKNVSVSALRTAVTIAGALYNQRIVLDKVNAVNKATNDMIESTSKMLREQGVEIQKQATEAALSPDVLQASFAEALGALDDINNYRQQALPMMKDTIDKFAALADEGERKIQELEKSTQF
ncbi:MAG: toxic anion resistance protein [Lachnospiraceae bacterium]|nr:toxic anion resistance protein [Lachnospiraceae bacterium]